MLNDKTNSTFLTFMNALMVDEHAERLACMDKTAGRILQNGGYFAYINALPCNELPNDFPLLPNLRDRVLEIQAEYPAAFPVHASLYAAAIALRAHAHETRDAALKRFPKLPPATFYDVFLEVAEERDRQDEKFGEQNLPSVHVSPTTQNVADTRYYGLPRADLARELCDRAHKKKQVTWAHIMAEEASEVVDAPDDTARRAELVQLAAVCVAQIQCIDRNAVREAQNA